MAHAGVEAAPGEGRGEGASVKRWRAGGPSEGGEREYLDENLRGRGRDDKHVHG